MGTFGIFLGFLLVSFCSVRGWTADDENRLIRDHLPKYDKRVRPVKNSSDAIDVTLDITFNNIIDVDEKSQILTMSMWLRQSWTNQLMAWEPKDYGGLTSVMLQATDVWQPDMILYENIVQDFDGRLDHTNTRVRINNDGATSWSTPFVMQTLCTIKVSDFPFDSQTCKLTFGSWQHDGRQINLINNKKEATLAKTRVKNGEWEVKKVAIERKVVYYQCCPDAPYPDVSFIIHMSRKSLFYFVNLLLPNILITLLAFFAFFIPVECGERISFVITVLLSMTVFMLIVADSIPPTSEAVPLIGIFYTASMVEVFLALIATGISLKINYSYLFGDGLSTRLKRVIFKCLGPLLGFDIKKVLGEEYLKELDQKIHAKKLGKQMQLNSLYDQGRNSGIMRLASGSDPEQLMILHQMKENGKLATKDDNENKAANGTMDGCTLSDTLGVDMRSRCDRNAFLKDIRVIAEAVKDQAEGEKKALESKLAASIVDKFFMWLFIIIFLLSTGLILIYLPRRNDI